MKRINIIFLLFFIFFTKSYSQSISVYPTNRQISSLEKNVLFNAQNRYTVTQTGSAALNLPMLFDGKFEPSYTATGPTDANPTVITIENLPDFHAQAGAWIGWSTRYWQPVKYKIEVYNVYGNTAPGIPANTWYTLYETTNNGYTDQLIQLPSVSVAKIRFTFYQGLGPAGQLGISELFYIHNEQAQAYDGLMVKYDQGGNVGINTATVPTGYKLAVKGNVIAEKLVVKTSTVWPDFVFKNEYKLPSLVEVEQFISKNSHLPEIPSAKEVETNGQDVGEMNRLLLKKVEEITLYLIELKKENQEIKKENDSLKRRIERLEK